MIELNEQLKAHLAGLSAAGVEWLPRVTAPPKIGAPAAPVVEVNVADSRRQELTVLADRVKQCTRCPELAATRTQTVFGVGPIDPELCFLGEAPGGDEDRQGEPFVGEAGQLLNRIISAMGMRREQIFICNILRCRPPGNRTPKPDECANCREYLDQTIELVRPKIICCWGGVAAQNLLGTTTGITRLRGQWQDYRGTPVMCTFHPANLLPGRSPDNKKFVWDDMQAVLKKLGREVPAK